MAAAKTPRQDKVAQKKANEVAVRDAIVAYYLETGEAVDSSTLAERMGWNVAKVRRVIAGAHGFVDGTSTYEDVRPSYSKNYTNFQQGVHKVWVFQPSLGHMRALLNAARGSIPSKA